MTIRQCLCTPFLLGGLVAGIASASPISGSFTAAGPVFEVTGTTISWLEPAPETFNFGRCVVTPTNDCAGRLAEDFEIVPLNSLNTIHNLDISAQPVGSTFAPFLFVEFPAAPTLPPLLINFVAQAVLPIGTANACGANPASAGQACIPPNPGGSPFLLINTSSGSSIASFRFSGITGESGTPGTPDFHPEGESTWTAQFTAPFTSLSFQDVLAQLTKNGKVTTSYSGDFKVTITPSGPVVPEPGTFALIGTGLIIGTFAARRLKKKSQV